MMQPTDRSDKEHFTLTDQETMDIAEIIEMGTGDAHTNRNSKERKR